MPITLQEPKHLDFSRDIIYAHPILQKKWPKLVSLFQQGTGHDLLLTCVWRSQKEQERLYAQGRTQPGKIVTQIDGVTKKSKHNLFPSQAIDVTVNLNLEGSKKYVSWDEDYYFPLREICAKFGLGWGGNFKTLRDFPHIEII